MSRFLHIVSQALSIAFYPLLMPAYGIALFCAALSARTVMVPSVFWWVSIVGTLVLTCIIPLTSILLLIRAGQVKDLYITSARERTTPYLYAAICFAIWTWFVQHALHAPLYLVLVASGATVALAGVMVVNRWWKISAHLTAFGGLMGGVLSYHLALGTLPGFGAISLLFIGTLLLMYARLYLQAHTPLQVIAGWLLGLLATFIPNLFVYYVA